VVVVILIAKIKSKESLNLHQQSLTAAITAPVPDRVIIIAAATVAVIVIIRIKCLPRKFEEY
jgi:hypothetical protein